MLRTINHTTDAATVELRSAAVHAGRIDHVCGTVGLVRAARGWLIDSFQLDACAGTPTPAPPPRPQKKASRPEQRLLPPGQAKHADKPGKQHGGGD